jgi:hypothetical protein
MTGKRLLPVFSLLILFSASVAAQDNVAEYQSDPRTAPSGAPLFLPRGVMSPELPFSALAPVRSPPPPINPAGPIAPLLSIGPAGPGVAFPESAALESLVRAAGVIFSGQVSYVGRSAGAAPGAGATTVTFKVEDAFRGVAVGQSLTIREWAGLWVRGEQYRVGERCLLFLYPESRLGFTSPVSRPMGRFEMRSKEMVSLNAAQGGILGESIERGSIESDARRQGDYQLDRGSYYYPRAASYRDLAAAIRRLTAELPVYVRAGK